ncbi:hypothetical protein BDF22DRAFT_745320 [Syncephalis plumigaleata]|nr:hypothetical protein BDF22DRAFT_745320 [Syncephalis plumigaleata]
MSSETTNSGAGEVYLVTGGDGFLGRHLVEALIRERSEAEIRVFDVRHQSVHAACQGVTTIFHLASLFSQNRKKLHQVNVEGTRQLLEAANTCQVRRVIFVSSATVVLNCTPIIDADETAPYATNPPDPYMTIMAWGKKTDRLVCALRPAMIYGNGDRNASPMAVYMTKSILGRWRLGEGGITNVIYVENAVYALLLAEKYLQPDSKINGQVFNIHDGYTINLYEVGRCFARELKVPNAEELFQWRFPIFPLLLYPFVNWEPPLRIRDVIMSNLTHTFSIEKAQTLLGYAPPIDRSEAFLRTRPWLQKLYNETWQ